MLTHFCHNKSLSTRELCGNRAHCKNKMLCQPYHCICICALWCILYLECDDYSQAFLATHATLSRTYYSCSHIWMVALNRVRCQGNHTLSTRRCTGPKGALMLKQCWRLCVAIAPLNSELWWSWNPPRGCAGPRRVVDKGKGSSCWMEVPYSSFRRVLVT